MQLMQEDKQIEITKEISSLYRSIPEKNYSHSDIKTKVQGLLLSPEFRYIYSHDLFRIFYILDDFIERIIAVAYIEHGKLINIEMKVNKFQLLGEQVTYKMEDVSKSIAMKSLDEHFGKIKQKEVLKGSFQNDEGKSSFRRNMDLIYNMFRLTNGIATQPKFTNENTLGAMDNYDDFSGKDTSLLSNNILLKSIDIEDFKEAKTLPYHTLFIDKNIIKQALFDLSPVYFAQMIIWYLPEMKVPKTFDKEARKEIYNTIKDIEELRESKFSKDNLKAWRYKQDALNALRLRIITIQSHA